MYKTLIRFLAIFIALTFWIHQMMLKDHKVSIDLPVEFSNLPSSLIISDTLNAIPAIFSGSGKDLIILNFNKPTIDIDASNFKQWNNLLVLKKSSLKFDKEINVKLEKYDVSENIFIKADRLITELKPVKIDFINDVSDPNLLGNFNVKLSQELIRITGPEQKLKEFSYIKTHKVSREKLLSERILNLELVTPKGTTLSSNTVKISLISTANSKRTFTLIPINYPENPGYKILPEKSTVIIEGRKETISKIDKKDIYVYAEFDSLTTNKSELQVILPENVSLIEITPKFVQIINNEKD